MWLSNSLHLLNYYMLFLDWADGKKYIRTRMRIYITVDSLRELCMTFQLQSTANPDFSLISLSVSHAESSSLGVLSR